MTLRISSPRQTARAEGIVRLSATVGDHELWFDVPADRATEPRGEPFLACLIVPAMVRGTPILVDPELPVCPDFLAGVHAYMDVVRFWPEELGLALTPVAVQASTSPAPPSVGTASFFSGGVDGLYTFLTERDRITEAVFAHGIDFQLASTVAPVAVDRNRAWLATHGVPLVEMASNARFIGHAFGVGWNSHNGACLAGYGHALGVQEILIASGHAWIDWMGSGSHPASEPLLSSSTTRVHHHGYGPMRWQKLARVSTEPGVPELLRVCWQDKGYNCGVCVKCRRTMLDLHLLGITAPSFPPATRLADLLPGRSIDWEDACYLRQSIQLAIRVGRRDAERALQSRLEAWERRQWLGRADSAFLGGSLRRFKRRFRRQTRPADETSGPPG